MFFHPNPCPRCQVVNLNGVLFPVKFKVLIVWPIQTSNKFDYISEGSNQKFTHKSSECKLALFLGIVVCWFKILYLFFHNMWSNPDQAICPCTKQGLINIINILFQADLQQSKWTASKQMDFVADKKDSEGAGFWFAKTVFEIHGLHLDQNDPLSIIQSKHIMQSSQWTTLGRIQFLNCLGSFYCVLSIVAECAFSNQNWFLLQKSELCTCLFTMEIFKWINLNLQFTIQ